MIVDLNQEVKVFNKEIGIKKVTLINLVDKQVTTEDNQKLDFNNIIFVHEIGEEQDE